MGVKDTTEELLTVKEAAQLLNVTEVTIKHYISKNLISSKKHGRAIRIVKNNLWNNFIQKKNNVKYKILNNTDYFVAEPKVEYTVQRELAKEERKAKLGFNGLTPTEWALLSKNVIVEDDLLNPVWNDLSSARNKYQLEHGAVYPIKLCERLIKMYSAEGDTVFDPFLGIGTTMIAAQQLKRHCIGTELNPKFADIAQNMHYKR